MGTESILGRGRKLARFDRTPPHGQPTGVRLVLATVVSLVGSLAVDAALVAAGEAVFPSTKHYADFQWHDYARLTIIGVVIACAGLAGGDPHHLGTPVGSSSASPSQ